MSLIYLYCLLPAEAEVSVQGVEGLEAGSEVRLVAAGKLQAVVSDVGPDFAEAQLNARIRDLDWLSPRAVRHHEVVDALHSRCKQLLPLSFGAIFRSERSLTRRLASQEAQLLASLERLRGREQWDLKLTRDEVLFAERLDERSPELRAASAELAAKPPGTRFLLEKKLQMLQAREAQRVAAAVRKEVHDTLRGLAVEAQRDQLSAPPPGQQVRLELKSSYLVEEAAADGLKLAVGSLSRKHASLGYTLDLSGPWPPFSFAGGLREALA
jgi:gas vesicle protein GvpL/GvpF